MLAVVQHQERPLVPQVAGEGLQQGAVGGLAQPERVRDRGPHQRRIGQRGEGHERDPVRERPGGAGDRGEGEAGLAHPAGPGQRHQAGRAQQAGHLA